MIKNVVIAGIGQTPVGEKWDISVRELAFHAIEKAVEDSGGLRPQSLYVGNMLASQLSHQAQLGTLIADFAGMNGIEAVSIDSAGASGGAALRAGYLAIASGMVDVALVVGVEKFMDQVGSVVEAALATAFDSDYEAVHGLTPTAQAAILMRRYLYEFDVPRSAFAGFALTAHSNGVANPNAMFRRAIKPDVYERAGIVCDPINMFDVAPNVDGAAALILTRQDLLPPGYPHPLIRVAGSSLVTDTLALHDRPDPLVFHAARLSVKRACRFANITPNDLDLFELHDSFSIYGLLSLEAAGYAEKGEGLKLVIENGIELDGSIPISTMGGSKARGNPGGATGIYQAVEAVLQLRGAAGDNQVQSACRAMIQSLGGPASTAATHILELID